MAQYAYICSIKFFIRVIRDHKRIFEFILWGDEIAKAWQTCPLVSGVEIHPPTLRLRRVNRINEK